MDIWSPATTAFIRLGDKYIEVKIISIPRNTDGVYTIQYPDGSIYQIHERYI